jgi:hypothetical protein
MKCNDNGFNRQMQAKTDVMTFPEIIYAVSKTIYATW